MGLQTHEKGTLPILQDRKAAWPRVWAKLKISKDFQFFPFLSPNIISTRSLSLLSEILMQVLKWVSSATHHHEVVAYGSQWGAWLNQWEALQPLQTFILLCFAQFITCGYGMSSCRAARSTFTYRANRLWVNPLAKIFKELGAQPTSYLTELSAPQISMQSLFLGAGSLQSPRWVNTHPSECCLTVPVGLCCYIIPLRQDFVCLALGSISLKVQQASG